MFKFWELVVLLTLNKEHELAQLTNPAHISNKKNVEVRSSKLTVHLKLSKCFPVRTNRSLAHPI